MDSQARGPKRGYLFPFLGDGTGILSMTVVLGRRSASLMVMNSPVSASRPIFLVFVMAVAFGLFGRQIYTRLDRSAPALVFHNIQRIRYLIVFNDPASCQFTGRDPSLHSDS